VVGGLMRWLLNMSTFQLTAEFQCHNCYRNNTADNKFLKYVYSLPLLTQGVRCANHPLRTYLSKREIVTKRDYKTFIITLLR
jgi:hypothetical protein